LVDERYSATGYGWLNFAGVMTGGALTYLGGWLRDSPVSLARLFQASAFCLLVVGVLLLTLRRPSSATAA
jgi:hypothetical protein